VLRTDDALAALARQCPERLAELSPVIDRAVLASAARQIVLFHLDRAWAEHLAFLADLREGIHLRALARGTVPLNEFNREAIRAFHTLLEEAAARSAETFLTAAITPDGVDLEASGLKRPTSTWTYLVHENPFGTDIDRAIRSIARRIRKRVVLCRTEWCVEPRRSRAANHRNQVTPPHLPGGKSGGGSPGTAAGPFIARPRRIPGIAKRQEFDMSDPLDWNAKTIAEFRANEGRVGGNFEGAPVVLLHHRGRKSGREYVTPTMYLPHDTRPDIIYVFATKAGAPAHPDWYRNLAAAGDGSVERGAETYQVTVRELAGAERDRIYAEQARRYPGFAEYERQTAGVRTIPVLELKRA
jgi:deazaflavin-dependent oxidoreductase (nitroreductase family)